MGSEPTTHVEPLDQGLVTARDQALLQPGELAKADNCVYMPNDPNIRKTKGRTVFNSTPITGAPIVKGLRLLNFDQATPLLVAHVGSDYQYAAMTGETGGPFAALATGVGSGTTLEAIQYNDKHYLLNGVGPQNYVVKSDGTTRLQGLQPVVNAPVVGSVSGSWNLALGVGYYYFFTVELVNPDSADEIESGNFATDGDILGAVFQFTSSNISNTSVTVTRPYVDGTGLLSTLNPTATHWRIYMAGPYQSPQAPPRSDFFAVGSTVDIGTSIVTIGNTLATGTNDRVPTADSITNLGGWTAPANAEGSTGADFTGANNNVGATTATQNVSTRWRTFGFAGLSGTFNGITVLAKVRGGGSIGQFKVGIRLTWNGGVSLTNEQVITCDVSGSSFFDRAQSFASWRVLTFGGPNNPWGRTWTLGTDFTDANFGVIVRYAGSSGPTIHLDYLKVTVHSASSSASANQITKGKQFPVSIISVAGITTTQSSHGLPPVATTGEIFEDQLVTNDVADASRIVYSLPTQPDYFPLLYFINFETKQTDEVTLVKRLGDKLLVGQKTQLFRVNYLPRETDSEFDRGRCYETVSEGQGVTGVQAAATFTAPGGPLLMAFVSYSGIHVTDGFQVDTLVDDLDWANTVDLPTAADTADYLKNAILVDYPQNYWLVLYYTPVGGTTNTKALVLHYHPSHRKQSGKLKVTGPLTVAALSATLGRVSDSPVLLTGSTGGLVYVEDRGYTQNQGGTLAVDVRTREMYPWGMDSTGTVEGILIRHDQDATSTVTVQPRLREADNAQTTGETALTFTTAQAGVASLDFHFFCDSVQFQLTEPGADGGSGMRIAAILATVFSRGGPE